MTSHLYAQLLYRRSSPGSHPNVLWAFYSYSTFDLQLLQQTVVLITVVSQGTYILFPFHVPCIIATLRGCSDRSLTKIRLILYFSANNYLILRTESISWPQYGQSTIFIIDTKICVKCSFLLLQKKPKPTHESFDGVTVLQTLNTMAFWCSKVNFRNLNCTLIALMFILDLQEHLYPQGKLFC